MVPVTRVSVYDHDAAVPLVCEVVVSFLYVGVLLVYALTAVVPVALAVCVWVCAAASPVPLEPVATVTSPVDPLAIVWFFQWSCMDVRVGL